MTQEEVERLREITAFMQNWVNSMHAESGLTAAGIGPPEHHTGKAILRLLLEREKLLEGLRAVMTILRESLDLVAEGAPRGWADEYMAEAGLRVDDCEAAIRFAEEASGEQK